VAACATGGMEDARRGPSSWRLPIRVCPSNSADNGRPIAHQRVVGPQKRSPSPTQATAENTRPVRSARATQPRSPTRIRSALFGRVRAVAAGAWRAGSCRARGRLGGGAIRVTTALTSKRTGRGLRGRVDLLELLAQLGMTTPGPRASADVTDSRSSNGGDRRLDTKLGFAIPHRAATIRWRITTGCCSSLATGASNPVRTGRG
jgi:hypothetical protein